MLRSGCQAVQAGQTLTANKSCQQDVCGTAAVNVETKPRVVLLLLDSSASRMECTDGSLECLSQPGSSATRPLSFWGACVTRIAVDRSRSHL